MKRSEKDVGWGFELKVDGAALESFESGDLISFEWISAVNEPPTGRLLLSVDQRVMDDIDKVEKSIGKEIRLELSEPGSSADIGYEGGSGLVFEGEVVAAERALEENGEESFQLTFTHRMQRLMKQSACKVWMSDDHGECKVKDVISTLISARGLEVDLESSSVSRNAIVQYRETDFNFLLRLAEDIGMYLDFRGSPKKVAIKTPQPGSSADVDLASSTMSCRISSATTPNKAVVESPPLATDHRVGILKGEATAADAPSKKAFGDLCVADLDVGVESKENAEVAVKSLLHALNAPMLRLDATVTGVVHAGDVVKAPFSMSELGDEFLVIASTISYARDSLTSTISGILNHADVMPPRKAMRPRIDGVLPAIVQELESEPEGIHRVKVNFQWGEGTGGEVLSAWARVATAWAGNERGAVFVPHVDDEVLLAFEHGDPSQPIIIGSLYNSRNVPPIELPAEWEKTIIKTAQAHTLTFEDKGGEEFVEVKTGLEEHTVLLDDANKVVKVLTGGGHSLIMDDDGKKITLESTAGAKLEMDDNGQKITIDGFGSTIELSASGIKVTGMQVEIKGDTKAAMEGAMAEVKGSAQLTLKGGITMIN